MLCPSVLQKKNARKAQRKACYVAALLAYARAGDADGAEATGRGSKW